MLTRQQRRFARRKRDEDPILSSQNIQSDTYLRATYENLIRELLACSTESRESPLNVVELGSAGGITKLIYPDVITSDIRESSGVDMIVDATQMPFASGTVDRIIAKDVLHHLPDPAQHFKEIVRVLKPGGVAAYAEPNWNLLSRVVFTFLHPEPFEPKQRSWSRSSSEPMDANQALAKILFSRDIHEFMRLFPDLQIDVKSPTYALSFLLAGGVYSRTRLSSPLLLRLTNLESASKLWMSVFGLNRVILVTKQAP